MKLKPHLCCFCGFYQNISEDKVKGATPHVVKCYHCNKVRKYNPTDRPKQEEKLEWVSYKPKKNAWQRGLENDKKNNK